MLTVIQNITGEMPPTCPWRAMYSPLVREVHTFLDASEKGNLAVAVGADPPAILIDAIGVFDRALAATVAENNRLAMEQAKQKQSETKNRRR